MDPGAEVSDRLVAWAFGPGRAFVDTVLAPDPVVRYWLSLRRRPLERLSVLFDEGHGGEVCARCVRPCCTQDVRWVVQLGHLLTWPLAGVSAAPAIGAHPEHCVYLGPRGCTLEAAARPAICSAFTCEALDERLGEPWLARIDRERTPLHLIEQAVFAYLGMRYAFVSGNCYAMLDATAAEMTAVLEGSGEHAIIAVDRTRQALADRREIAGTRHLGRTLAPARSAPAPVLPEAPAVAAPAQDLVSEAAALLDARAHAAEKRLANARALLATPAAAPGDIGALTQAVLDAKTSHLSALDAYARAACMRCPRAGASTEPLPLPSSRELASHRRTTLLGAIAEGASTGDCFYMHCARSNHLDLGDVAAWHGLGKLPVLAERPEAGRCVVLGEAGCAQEPSARAPACDRFACSEVERFGAQALAGAARDAEWMHGMLYSVLRAAGLSVRLERYVRVLGDAEAIA